MRAAGIIASAAGSAAAQATVKPHDLVLISPDFVNCTPGEHLPESLSCDQVEPLDLCPQASVRAQ